MSFGQFFRIRLIGWIGHALLVQPWCLFLKSVLFATDSLHRYVACTVSHMIGHRELKLDGDKGDFTDPL